MDTADLKYNDRQIRVFISSTFRDMQEERDYLVKYIFPQLRKLCESRDVVWGEVDLRWGVTDEQAAEGKVLPICLEEIKRCRPYFIGLLGERYGWVPDIIPPELLETEPWLKEQFEGRKSVTELEILHGVLRDPKMAGHAYFYFRDPEYIKGKSSDFASEDAQSKEKVRILKQQIRAKQFPVRENYPTPEALGELVLKDLTAVINTLYPEGTQPDPLDREARDHEAYARSRTQVYIGRDSYYRRLDEHAARKSSQPLVLLGESGCGKSALLANWVRRYRKTHPDVFVIQHYIGASPYSADWAAMLRRIMGEFKRNLRIEEEIPSKPDELRDAFKVWLYQAAARKKIVLVLDALNQLADSDRAPDLPWLPLETPADLRLFVSTLPGRPLEEIRRRNWPEFEVTLLETEERRKLIAEYLKLQAKRLEARRIDRIINAPPSANPLYLKVLLDELRVFGIHEQLDERIDYYLGAQDPFELYGKVIARWQEDYGRGTRLVDDTLSLLWAARRGLSETELLDLLGQTESPPSEWRKLPRAKWSPLYLAMSNALISRGGLLTFAHDFIRKAVRDALIPAEDRQKQSRLRLADYFEGQAVSLRQADELPWLLQQAGQRDRLRSCLLDIDRFLLMRKANENELLAYWVWLGQERTMGRLYLKSFEIWGAKGPTNLGYAANALGYFLFNSAQYAEAEPLYKRALAILEKSLGENHPDVATVLNNLAMLYQAINRLSEAEPLMKRALAIDEAGLGKDHPSVARDLNNLAQLYQDTNRLSEAELLYKRALAINEASLGKDHPSVARDLNNLAGLYRDTNRLSEAEPLIKRVVEIFERSLGKDHLKVATALNNLAGLYRDTNRLSEAEPLMKRALAINEASLGKNHPDVARDLNNLAMLYRATNRLSEAEPLMKRALAILEKSLGENHSKVAMALNNLALLYQATNRLSEAEPLKKRALAIDEASLGKDNPSVASDLNNLATLYYATNRLSEAEPLYKRALAIWEKSLGENHPNVATALNNLAELYRTTNRLSEAEPLYKRALAIDEKSLGKDHPTVAIRLNNLAQLYQATNRLSEAEPLYKRALAIVLKYTQQTGHTHPRLNTFVNNYSLCLQAMGLADGQIRLRLNEILRPFGMSLGG
jgi:tetratricopeptide (TPR) repeat protein